MSLQRQRASNERVGTQWAARTAGYGHAARDVPFRSERRTVVTELWLQGVIYAHITPALGCTLSTVRRNTTAACVALQLDHLATLNLRLARSLACGGLCNGASGSSMLAWMTAASTRAHR